MLLHRKANSELSVTQYFVELLFFKRNVTIPTIVSVVRKRLPDDVAPKSTKDPTRESNKAV